MIKERQVVETNFTGMIAAFIEPTINREASTFMTEHLDEIRRQVRKMGISQDMIDDLISDVWLSISEAENRGEGYDVERSNEGDMITPDQFVYGRLKGYSMNVKYRSDASERHISKDRKRNVEIFSASCTDASDLDGLDNFQKAYALASSSDDLEDVEAEMSLRSNLELCIKFNDAVGFNVINFFKNMDMFSSVTFNTGIFDRLKDTMNSHTDFRDAFKEIMVIAINRKPVFESVVDALN